MLHQALSDDEDDKNDEYDSGFFPYRNAQNLRRIKQRKGNRFIQEPSHDEDDRGNRCISLTSPHFNYPSEHTHQTPPVEACMPMCEPFPKKSEKYQPNGIHGLNRRFERVTKSIMANKTHNNH